jgi:hypothetical protein
MLADADRVLPAVPDFVTELTAKHAVSDELFDRAKTFSASNRLST